MKCLLLPFGQCPLTSGVAAAAVASQFSLFSPHILQQFPVTTIVSLGSLASVYLLILAGNLDVERAGTLLCLELCLLIFLGFEGQGKEKSAFTSQQPTMCHSDPHPLF